VVDGFVDVVSWVVVVLVCANAKGATSPQTKAIIVLFTLCLLFDLFTPTVRDSGQKRTLFVRNLFIRLVLRQFGIFAGLIDLSRHREFGNMERQ
jgi:hypothetical protein